MPVEKSTFLLYRTRKDGTLELVDTYTTMYAPTLEVVADQYLYDSADGEVYTLVSALSGRIIRSLRVENVKRMVVA